MSPAGEILLRYRPASADDRALHFILIESHHRSTRCGVVLKPQFLMETALDAYPAAFFREHGCKRGAVGDLSGTLHLRRGGSAIGNAHPVVVPGGIEEGQAGGGFGSSMHRLDLIAQFHRRIGTQIYCLGAAQAAERRNPGFRRLRSAVICCTRGHVADLAFRAKSQLVSRHVLRALLGLRAQVGTQNQMAAHGAGALDRKGVMGSALSKFARGTGNGNPGCQLRS